MIGDRRIRDGMTVYSADGEKLGKVLVCDAPFFTIEKGFFFPKDYVARIEDIADITGDEIRLTLTKDTFVHTRDAAAAANAPERTTGEGVRVTLLEEEVGVRKRPVAKEEVRLRRDRVTEQRAAEADVRNERLDIEGDDRTTPRSYREDEEI